MTDQPRTSCQNPFCLISWLVPLCWIGIITLYWNFLNTVYVADSYTYIMLGQHLLSGLGYTSDAIRDFYSGADPYFSRSYPPLQPLLYGIADWIFHGGIITETYVSLILLYGILLAWFCLSLSVNRYFTPALPFITIAFFSAANFFFMYEVLAGTPIPTALLLLLIILYLSLRDALGTKRCMFIGLLLGGLYLARFDTSLFVLTYPVLLFVLKKLNIRQGIIVYSIIALAILPWTIRNLVTFGVAFSSDNTIAVQSTTYLTVLCFFKNGPPLGIHDPSLWIYERMLWAFSNMQTLYLYFSPLGSVVFLLFGVGFFTIARQGKEKILFYGTLLWLVINIVTTSLPLNDAPRYFAISSLLICYCAILTALALIGGWLKKPVINTFIPVSIWTSILTSSIVMACVFLYGQEHFQQDTNKKNVFGTIINDFKDVVIPGARVACIQEEDLAYYSGWKTIYLPYNFLSENINSENINMGKMMKLHDWGWKNIFQPPLMHQINPDFIAWRDKFKVHYIVIDKDADLAHNPLLPHVAISNNVVLLDIKDVKATER